MGDVRDILGVPRGQTAERQEAPKTKEKMQRPAGMSREAFALLGGSHPIVPSQLTEELRKKEDLKGLKQKRKSAKGQVGAMPISVFVPCIALAGFPRSSRSKTIHSNHVLDLHLVCLVQCLGLRHLHPFSQLSHMDFPCMIAGDMEVAALQQPCKGRYPCFGALGEVLQGPDGQHAASRGGRVLLCKVQQEGARPRTDALRRADCTSLLLSMERYLRSSAALNITKKGCNEGPVLSPNWEMAFSEWIQ